ncbi:MAG: hypothetical protein ABIV39_14280 [Verrucomicrobiota bacterium]
MTDHFALLDEARRPWIEPDALKQKFFPLSAPFHPDRVHGGTEAEKLSANQRYAELNGAYNSLREPKERLLHLIELESGKKPSDIQKIPSGTMDLFVEVGQTCRDADTFLVEKSKVTSPLLQVQLFERGQDWSDKLLALQQKINAKRDELSTELRQLNQVWESARPVGSPNRTEDLPLERLEQIYRVFSYIARWSEQIQERVVQLSF